MEIVDGQKKVFDKNRETSHPKKKKKKKIVKLVFALLCGTLCALPCERPSKMTVIKTFWSLFF